MIEARPVLWRQLATIVAIGLGLVAQQHAQNTPYALVPWALYLLAAVLMVVAGWTAHRAPAAPTAPPATDGFAVRRVLFTAAALALAIFVAPVSEPGARGLIALAMWIAAMVLAGAATRGWQVSPRRDPRRACSWPEWLAVCVLLLAALVARVAWIETLPRYYFGDESRLGVALLRMSSEGPPDFFTIGWNTWPVLGIGLQGWLTPLLGLDIAALRLSSAVAGTLTVLATYLLARQLFSVRVALLSAVLLAIGRTAIDFSRLGICHAQVACFEAFAFYFWWRAIDTGRAGAYLCSGIAAGLCLYSYNAGQLAPLLLLGWVAAALVCRPRLVRTHWRGVLVMLLGLAVTVVPLLLTVTDQLQFGATWNEWTYMARNRQTVDQAVAAWRSGGWAAAAAFVGQQAAQTWLGFTVIPSDAYQLGYRGSGMLDHVSGPLFVLGLALCLAAPCRARRLFLLFWWLVTAIVGGVMTNSPPAFVRLVGLLPVLAILAALPLDWLVRSASGIAWRRALGIGAVTLLLAAACWDNWRTYFVEFPSNTADETSEMVHLIRPLSPMVETLLVGSEHFLRFNDEVFTLEFPDRHLESVAEPAHLFPLHRPLAAGVAVLLGPTQVTLADYARTLYPNLAQRDVVRPTDGALLFRALLISGPDIRKRTGLRRDPGDAPGEVTGLRANDPFSAPTSKSPSKWRGRVYWPTDQPARLLLESDRAARVTVAGVTVELGKDLQPAARDLTLPRGWHRVAIERPEGVGRSLAVKIDDGTTVKQITTWDLQPSERSDGLVARYEHDGKLLSQTVAPQLNDFVVEALFREGGGLPVQMPFTAAWEGALRVDRPGRYQLEVIGSGPYSISLDGKPLFEERNIGAEEPRTVQIERELTAGLHPLQARWDSTAPAHTTRRIFQLYWTPPEGERTLVPPTAFAPAAR